MLEWRLTNKLPRLQLHIQTSCLYCRLRKKFRNPGSKMDLDNDEFPPELIETTSEAVEEEKLTKVPITVVTGRFGWPPASRGEADAGNTHRIPGRGEDYAAQLHPDGRAWQEDCRHNEWCCEPASLWGKPVANLAALSRIW